MPPHDAAPKPDTGGAPPISTKPPTNTPESPPESSRVDVIMEPGAAPIGVGETLIVHVLIAGGHDVASAPFHVTFDPGVLRFESGQEGEFLRADGAQTAFFAAATAQGDTVVVGLSRLGAGPGAAGSGELCALRFLAVGSGDASLRFTNAKIRDGDNRIVASVYSAKQVIVRQR